MSEPNVSISQMVLVVSVESRDGGNTLKSIRLEMPGAEILEYGLPGVMDLSFLTKVLISEILDHGIRTGTILKDMETRQEDA